jgi:hypothetical protein
VELSAGKAHLSFCNSRRINDFGDIINCAMAAAKLCEKAPWTRIGRIDGGFKRIGLTTRLKVRPLTGPCFCVFLKTPNEVCRGIPLLP